MCSWSIKNKVPVFTSRGKIQGTTTIHVRQNQAPTVGTIQSSVSRTHSQSFWFFSRGLDHLFSPTLSGINTACLPDPSLLHFPVAGSSGDCHPAQAFPKLLGSAIATGQSLEVLALPHICKPQLFPIIPSFLKTKQSGWLPCCKGWLPAQSMSLHMNAWRCSFITLLKQTVF